MQKKAVFFYYHHTRFHFPNRKNTANWLCAVSKTHHYTIDKYTVVFCLEDYLLELNKAFLRHNTHTDIITFDFADKNRHKKKKIFAECYISIPRVKDNALKFATPFQIELRRVLAHGILHLCGFKDNTAANKEKMRKAEAGALKTYKQFI